MAMRMFWDQWISYSGTALATASLALALEPAEVKRSHRVQDMEMPPLK
jgi:hypothetical protein